MGGSGTIKCNTMPVSYRLTNQRRFGGCPLYFVTGSKTFTIQQTSNMKNFRHMLEAAAMLMFATGFLVIAIALLKAIK